MKLRVQFAGAEYTLDVRRNGLGSAYQVAGALTLEGLASVEEISPGVYSVLDSGRSFVVRLAETAIGVEAWVGGRRYAFTLSDPRDRAAGAERASAAGPQEIRALMPGKVVKVLVRTGEAVKAGDGVIIVEAMKMQNEMKAPKDGVVVRIDAGEGATVAAGETLMVVE